MENILVVVDMQNDFVEGALGTEEAKSIINNAVREIKNFSGKIYATLDTHPVNYMNTGEGKVYPPHCIRGTNGWKLNSKIYSALSQKNYETVEKNTFGSALLPNLIRKYAGDRDFSLRLIGLCTDICVISNALILKANFPQKEIAIISSCCAGTTPKDHIAALKIMKSCQIIIL